MPKKFIRIKGVATTRNGPGRYPMSKATIYRLIAAGQFPRPVKLGPGISAWDCDDLDGYDNRIAQHKV
jgi:predicted DNA-binding transcriptional regulator AlpA